MFNPPPRAMSYDERVEAFLQEMREQAGAVSLRRWARDQIRAAGGERVELDYIPGFFGWTFARMPKLGVVEPNDGEPYVHLVWSNGTELWGLKIGSPDYEAADGPRDYHVYWSPGIYAWHEIDGPDGGARRGGRTQMQQPKANRSTLNHPNARSVGEEG